MVKRAWGDEARGEDDDGDPAPRPTEKKVQIDNAYFDKLKERLIQQFLLTPEPTTAEQETPAGLVVYNDDGSVYKRPGG